MFHFLKLTGKSTRFEYNITIGMALFVYFLYNKFMTGSIFGDYYQNLMLTFLAQIVFILATFPVCIRRLNDLQIKKAKTIHLLFCFISLLMGVVIPADHNLFNFDMDLLAVILAYYFMSFLFLYLLSFETANNQDMAA